jgi:diguanylate cyclase (GGDEF)-like protein/PAS domain S-box-containing protein
VQGADTARAPITPTAIPWWRRFRWTIAGVVLSLLWLILALGPLHGHANEPLLASLGRVPLLALAAWLGINRAFSTVGRRRLSLLLIASSLLSIAVGEVLWAVHFASAVGPLNHGLGLWDAFYLAYFVLLLLGLLLLPRIFSSRSDLVKFVLDATIVVVGGGMFIWQFGMSPLLAATPRLDTLGTWIDIAYPLGDLLTLVGVSTILLRLPGGAARGSYVLLSMALLLSMFGDLVWAMSNQHTLPVATGDLLARSFWFAQAVFFLAAAEATRAAGIPIRTRTLPRATLSVLPYVAIVAGYSLVAWMAATDRLVSLRALLMWASAMMIAVVLRQAIANRENTQLLRERERIAGESRLAKLIENAADGILVLASDLVILYASAPAQRMLLGNKGNLRGRSLRDLLHPDDVDSLSLKLAQHDRVDSTHTGKLMLRFTPNDAAAVITETTFTDQRSDPELAGIVLNIRDVTAHQALEDQLRHNALHEPLTQLPGRELFLDRVTRGVARIGQGVDHLAIAVLEIDQYRLINDSLGHVSGDQLLVMCTDRLKRQKRESDTLARLNDTGFALLLEVQGDAAQIIVRMERLINAFASPFVLGASSLRVTCSLGLATAESNAITAAELLRNADTALTMARADGGGRYRTFTPEQHTQVMERLSVQAFIPEAIEQGKFVLHLQPIVGLVDRFPIALRPRVMWRNPTMAPFPIKRLREAARNNDVGMQLSEWVLDRAQREFANVIRYQNGAQHLSLLIPISGKHLRHPDMLDRVQQLLQALGLAAVHLHLSITEDTLGEDIDSALIALRRLRGIGVRLGLAEFGGRASSLASLQENLFDTLLLSSQLVRSLTATSQATALIRGVIALCEGLGARVIAAGVDDASQREILSELGCLYGMGEALAPAMPIEHLLPWLGGRLAEAM